MFVSTSRLLSPVTALVPDGMNDQYAETDDESTVEEEFPDEYEEQEDGLEGEDSDWSDYLDEGTIAVLLVAGGFLFLVPEPVTSMAGILLLAAGFGGLVIDALN